jgi:hypothetical protein
MTRQRCFQNKISVIACLLFAFLCINTSVSAQVSSKDPSDGKKHLEQLLASYPQVSQWESRKKELKSCFLRELGLVPFPKKTDLHPIFTPARNYDGYSVENVAIETMPGVYLCGSLYKPKGSGPFAAVLSPHGHFPNADLSLSGRYRPDQQYRCATLARMGAVVFSYEMLHGENRCFRLTRKIMKQASLLQCRL